MTTRKARPENQVGLDRNETQRKKLIIYCIDPKRPIWTLSDQQEINYTNWAIFEPIWTDIDNFGQIRTN